MSYGATGSLFAGGWVSNTEPGNPSVVVDAFDTAAPGGSVTVTAPVEAAACASAAALAPTLLAKQV